MVNRSSLDQGQDGGASASQTGLSPQVEPASGLDGSATSIPSASSLADVLAVASRIRAIPDAVCPAFAARLLTDGLMTPSQWLLRLAHWIARKRHGLSAYEAWGFLMSREWGDGGIARATANALAFREQTAAWCEGGKDSSDRRSVGGFNQEELERVDFVARKLASAMSGSAQDPQGLGPKGASAAREAGDAQPSEQPL